MKERARRGDKRIRTREKLIAAAADLIRNKGFEAVSLEEIARRAGMTRGAFYNNFKSRDELFVAVAATLWRPVEPDFHKGASFSENMRAMGRAVAAAARDRREMAVGAMSFQVYALTHDELRQMLVYTNASIYKWAEQKLLEFVSEADLPMPPNQFVRVLHALTEGLLTLHFLTPELVTDKTIEGAFEALG